MRRAVIATFIIIIGCTAPAGSKATTPVASGPSIEKAEMLATHGLVQDATRELIDVIFGASGDVKLKAEAYYMLGTLAFREGRVRAAADAWTELVRKYPQSQQAISVKDRINQLSEVVQDASKVSTHDAVAQSYLDHGNFWSE